MLKLALPDVRLDTGIRRYDGSDAFAEFSVFNV